MATGIENTAQMVIDHPQSNINVQGGTRTYREVLTDPKASPAIKYELIQQFQKEFIKPPPSEGLAFEALPTTETELQGRVVPAKSDLQTGEYLTSEGDIAYSPDLEATQRQTISINIGALARGTTSYLDPSGTELEGVPASARYNFELGTPTEGGTEVTFELPVGMRPDEMDQVTWDKILRVVESNYPEEFNKEKKLETDLSVFGKSGLRGFLSSPAAITDVVGAEIFRFADYLLSPVGTKTAMNDIGQWAFGMEKPMPDDITKDEYPRLLERLGLYPTEHEVPIELRDILIPGAAAYPTTVRDPSKEMFRVTQELADQLVSVTTNMDMPTLLTPEQLTESQRIAGLVGEVMGGAIGEAGLFKAGAKLVSKGFNFEELTNPSTLQRAVMDLANTPSIQFAHGGRRRFTIPGGAIYGLREFGFAGTAGTAMALTPEEWGPWGQVATGIAAPFSLSKARDLVGVGLRKTPVIGGFLEPFSSDGQKRLAGRALAYAPGLRGNERLVVALLDDLSEAPTVTGTTEVLETPAFFDEIAKRLEQAELDWRNLSKQGLSEEEIFTTLSQNESYGKYLSPTFNLLDGDNTLSKLTEVRGGVKSVADGLYGALNQLASGATPVSQEVVRSAADRMVRSQNIFDSIVAQNIEGDVNAPIDWVESRVAQLANLVDDSLGAFATDAAIYNEIVERVGDGVAEINRLNATDRALLAVKASFDEARQIERAMYSALGANEVSISPDQIQRIGDRAAELILSTPVAQRKQIPPIIYQIAGRNRLLEEQALLKGDIGAAAGAAESTPRQLITARATRASLETDVNNVKREVDSLLDGAEKSGNKDSGIFIAAAEMEPEQLNVLLNRTPKELTNNWGLPEQRAKDLKTLLKDFQKKRNSLRTLENKLDAQNSKISSLEEELLPKFETEGGEAVEIGPNGIIDNKTTIDEVLAARSVLLDSAAKAVGRKNKYGNKIAVDLQSFIVDDWIQDPSVFGDLVDASNFSRNYDIVRNFSRQLNDRYTRGIVGEFWQQGADKQAKQDPNQFLARIVNETKQSESVLPTGSVDEFEASLVKANSPFIIKENGQIEIDFDRPLTPGMPEEGFTWEQITSGDVPLSTDLLREEVLNRFALSVVNPKTGEIDPKKIDLFLGPTGYQGVINKIEETIPGFKNQLLELGSSGEKIAVRHRALTKPDRNSIDTAAASMNLDDLVNVIQASPIRTALVHDNSVMNLFLGRDGKLYAKNLLENPKRFSADIDETLNILRADESGAAVNGFRQSVLDELIASSRSPDPTDLKGRGEDIIIDPRLLNEQLIVNEDALRKVFNDRVNIDGKDMSTFDMLKIFNDETLRASDILRGKLGGPKTPISQNLFRGQETIRNMGRIAGVKVAGWTGGPALVLAGTGGRLAGKVYDSAGNVGVYEALYAALKDPAFAQLLLVDTAKLNKKGKFDFDRTLTKKMKPFFALRRPATMLEVGERAAEVQKEEERRRGEKQRVFNPDTKIYEEKRLPIKSRWQSPLSSANQAPLNVSQVNPSSVLSQVNPVSAIQGGIVPQTMARGQQVFGATDPIFAKDGGIVSIKRKKARQLVI